MRFLTILILSIVCSTVLQSQTTTPILDRKVTIKIVKQTLGKTLNIIAETANFNFSYSNSVVKTNKIVSIMAENRSVREVLDQLFNKELSYQQIGNHLVLQRKPVPKQTNHIQGNSDKPIKYSYIITGYIRNLENGDGLSQASIYDKQTLSGTVSGDFGYYKLEVSSRLSVIELRFSKSDYKDTIVKIGFQNNGVIDCHINLVSLIPTIPKEIESDDTLIPIQISDSVQLDTSKPQLVWADSSSKSDFNIENTRAGKWLISAIQKLNEKNIRDSIHRDWQVTFFPPISTNGELSGLVVNKLSWNLIAGYNGGLDGVEFGGLLNVLRQNMRGAQFSGFGNVVGGDVEGAQFAGFFNHTIGNVNAFQAAGFYNYNRSAATGAQFAGFINLNKGVMTGFQAAGFMNIAEAKSELVQFAGFMNLSSNIYGFQGAGFMNIAAGNSILTQAAGFMNISKEIYGAQIAGFMNVAQEVNGSQIAGFMNVADEVNGAQIAGFMNIARKVNGFQLGVFNIADSVNGFALGIFNFIKNGLHQLEFSTNEIGQYGIAYRSGMDKFYSNVMVTSQLPIRDSGTLITNGFGFGTRLRFSDAFRITVDLTCHQLTLNFISKNLNLQNRLQAALEWRLFKGFAVFGGVAVNHMLNDTRDLNYNNRFKNLGPNAFWNQGGTYAQRAWLGYQFGLRLL